MDNKPFDGALQAIFGMERRSCVRRILAYVNPDPGDGPEGNSPGQLMPPLGVVVAESVLGIPQSQSISDHLNEIREHNETVRMRRDSVVELVRCLDATDLNELPAKLFDVYRARRLADTFEHFVYASLPRAAMNRRNATDGLSLIGRHGREQLKAIFTKANFDVWLPRRWPSTADDPRNQVGSWGWGLFPVEFSAKVMLDILRKAQDLSDYSRPPGHHVLATVEPTMRGEREAQWRDPILDKPDGTDTNVAWHTRARDWDREVEAPDPPAPSNSDERLAHLWAQAYIQVRALGRMRRSERKTWDRNTRDLLDTLDGHAKSETASTRPIVSSRDFEVMFAFLGEKRRPLKCAIRARRIAAIVYETSKIAVEIAQSSLDSGRLRQPDVEEAWALHSLGTHFSVLTQGKGSAAAGHDAVQEVLFKLLQLEVIEFAFNDHARLDSDAVIELAQISGDSTSPLGGPSKATCKLLGLQLAHFGAFYKRSWRANDWTYGRLDGAERLIRLLLNPERLHRFYFGASAAAAEKIREIGLNSVPSDAMRDELARLWSANRYWEKIRTELAFLDSVDARLPDALPMCAEALTARLHYGILRDELPHLVMAIADDQSGGADTSGEGEALLRSLGARDDGGTVHCRPFSPEQARQCLERGLIAGERLVEEAGSDLFTRTLTHSAATLQNLLASKTAKLGPVSTLFASLRVPILGFYFVAQGLTHQSRTSAALNGGILAAGAALVCFALLIAPGPSPGILVTLAWTMLAYGLLASVVRAPRTVGLAVWILILVVAVTTQGLVLGAIVAAVALLTLSVTWERLQWLQWAIGFIVIGMVAIWESGMLHGATPSRSSDGVHILVLAGVVCLALLLAVWQALPVSATAERWARLRLKGHPLVGQQSEVRKSR